ncbi:hypothetical protein SAMN04489798_4350 [Pseudomonas arsenicoxydans]|uniref:Uncharacterized protein n=1 Tax=Pseudomonas arsenicoxydans TaxID=702115 RepID=A0A1H0NY18_9PSED|nr:hypothetical protein [Pseudomonas arsenicoxydans]SDO97672.1 hypothetical protein SAMN04489798_4350 [Pseudomonas arsenicoxydans]
MKHELWLEPDGRRMFCVAGIHGEEARSLLHADAQLIWQVEADSYFEAMTQYYSYMAWGKYQSDFPEQDKATYRELGWESAPQADGQPRPPS